MMQARALRALPLQLPQAFAVALPPPPRLSVAIATFAVALQLLVSSNVLVGSGIAYDTPGGNPLMKFHPATFLVVLALLVRMFAGQGRPLWTLERLAGRFPAASLFLGVFLFLIVYSTISVGATGVAIYVESYVAAGVLWIVLADASPRQLRLLAWMMLSLFALNAVVGVAETLVHRHVTPYYTGATIYVEIPSEFRGLAFYDHALTGAMMTQMALFLLLAMRLPPVLTAVFGLPLLIGLLGFGGRTALLVSIVTLLLLGGIFMVRDAARRTLAPRTVFAAVVGVAGVGMLGFYLLTETSVGLRIAGKLAFQDASTEARSVQWLIPSLMTLQQQMFGLPLEDLPTLVFQLGLIFPFTDVENFWLLAFIGLGAVGFTIYLLGFLSYLWSLWRAAPLFGRVILVTTMLVASTSNSLGRKSNILFVMTAAVLASTGFAPHAAADRPDPRLSATRPAARALRPRTVPPSP